MALEYLRQPGLPSRSRRVLWLVAIVVAATWLLLVRATAEDYRIGPLDKLRIKVSEWRAASSETFEWAALGGEFTVDASGMLSMPIIGAFSAGGTTTADIARTISERLKSLTGLVNGPIAAVEVAQYRPFYVAGAVERPGEYAFRPGLTVMQAVSIAGGFYRAEASLARFERDTITAEGEIKAQDNRRLALLLRRDRLVAESQNADQITFSAAVTQYPDARQAQQGMREEGSLFAARQTTIKTQSELLARSKAMLEGELQTLAAKSVALIRQQDLVRKDLAVISALMSKGLSVSPRQLALEQNLAQLETQALDLVLATARTRQDIGKADLTLAETMNKRETEISRELRDTQVDLTQATDRIEALKALVYESSVSAPRLLAKRERDALRLGFAILRSGGGEEQEISASAADRVQPGDIIKVGRPVGDVNQEAALASGAEGERRGAVRRN